jgi:uncharacterized protein YaaQ
MKMVMAIVHRDESARVLEALITAGYSVTSSESRGGMLRETSQTLLIGIEAERLKNVLSIIKENCRSQVSLEATEADVTSQMPPRRLWAEVGGAVIFVWTIDQFEIF